MAGPPHHTEGAGSPICGFPRLTQRKSPFSSNATRPPCWWDSSGFCLFTSFASHPPVTKQTCPSPLQSPAAMDAFPSTAPITLMAFQKSFGALQLGEPSEPRMARITPRVSTVPPLPFSGANELKATAGSASPGCRRMTTGVDITSTKSGYSRSLRIRPLNFGSSGPSGEVNGHHQACAGGSKAPWGMKMQVGSAGLHCGTEGRQSPLAQKKLAGQVLFAHELGTDPVRGMLQVPSAWQTLPPPPQSESRWQGACAWLQLPSGQLPPRPLPHPASAAAMSSARIPLAIPHPPPARTAGAQEVWTGSPGGNPPERRVRETPSQIRNI